MPVSERCAGGCGYWSPNLWTWAGRKWCIGCFYRQRDKERAQECRNA